MPCAAVSWRADSNVLVSASEDGTVKIWEMTGGKQLKSFNAHGGGVTDVMMAKDGRIVTCGKDSTVKLWKNDGNLITTFPSFSEAALEAVITHDGSKVIGGDCNGRAIMWNRRPEAGHRAFCQSANTGRTSKRLCKRVLLSWKRLQPPPLPTKPTNRRHSKPLPLLTPAWSRSWPTPRTLLAKANTDKSRC